MAATHVVLPMGTATARWSCSNIKQVKGHPLNVCLFHFSKRMMTHFTLLKMSTAIFLTTLFHVYNTIVSLSFRLNTSSFKNTSIQSKCLCVFPDQHLFPLDKLEAPLLTLLPFLVTVAIGNLAGYLNLVSNLFISSYLFVGCFENWTCSNDLELFEL